MDFFDYERNDGEPAGSERFWIVLLVLLYGASTIQLIYGDLWLAVANFGLSVVFTVEAYQNFWMKEEE